MANFHFMFHLSNYNRRHCRPSHFTTQKKRYSAPNNELCIDTHTHNMLLKQKAPENGDTFAFHMVTLTSHPSHSTSATDTPNTEPRTHHLVTDLPKIELQVYRNNEN